MLLCNTDILSILFFNIEILIKIKLAQIAVCLVVSTIFIGSSVFATQRSHMLCDASFSYCVYLRGPVGVGTYVIRYVRTACMLDNRFMQPDGGRSLHH